MAMKYLTFLKMDKWNPNRDNMISNKGKINKVKVVMTMAKVIHQADTETAPPIIPMMKNKIRKGPNHRITLCDIKQNSSRLGIDLILDKK